MNKVRFHNTTNLQISNKNLNPTLDLRCKLAKLKWLVQEAWWRLKIEEEGGEMKEEIEGSPQLKGPNLF